MNKKKTPVLFAIGAISALLLTLAIAFVIAPALRKPVIAYYRIPDTIRTAITALADDPAFVGKNRFGILVLDEKRPLSDQVGKKPRIDLIFTYDGAAAAELAPRVIAPSEQLKRLMPSAMRRAGMVRETAYGMPLLLDHFEVAYNKDLFSLAMLSEPKTLDELVKDAKKISKPGMWPIVCAGANDGTLLMLVGALAEARFGSEARMAIVEALAKTGSVRTAMDDTKLRAILAELVMWRKTGILHPEWFRMQDKDVKSFMENEYTGIAFMTLSEHRTIPLKTISKFASIPFPPAAIGTPRDLTAPVMIGLLPSHKRPNADAAEFLFRLARAEGQTILSSATGLAPVNSTAEAQDIQASDVRLWVAASSRAVPDPATAALADPAKVAEIARTIREYIEANGAGY